MHPNRIKALVRPALMKWSEKMLGPNHGVRFDFLYSEDLYKQEGIGYFSCAACVAVRARFVTFNRDFLELNLIDHFKAVEEVMVHELAHVVAGTGDHRDKTFTRACVAYGVHPGAILSEHVHCWWRKDVHGPR